MFKWLKIHVNWVNRTSNLTRCSESGRVFVQTWEKSCKFFLNVLDYFWDFWNQSCFLNIWLRTKEWKHNPDVLMWDIKLYLWRDRPGPWTHPSLWWRSVENFMLLFVHDAVVLLNKPAVCCITASVPSLWDCWAEPQWVDNRTWCFKITPTPWVSMFYMWTCTNRSFRSTTPHKITHFNNS